MKKLAVYLVITLVFCAMPGLGVHAEKASDGKAAAAPAAEEAGSGAESETDSGKTEGSGFDTPEEAAEAYIQGMINWDVSEMLAACAVETYAENYDLAKQIERVKAMQPVSNTLMLNADPFAYQLNVETRRTFLTRMMKSQYLTMADPELARLFAPVPLSGQDSAADLVAEYYTSDSPEIRFTGMFVPPVLLISNYYAERSQYNMAFSAYTDNAQQIGAVAALIYVNDDLFLLTLGTERYGDKWYVTANNMLAAMLGLDSQSGGMCSATEALGLSVKEVEALYDELLSDGKLMELTHRIEEKTGEVDISAIFELPQDERGDAFAEAYASVYGSLTKKDLEYIEDISDAVMGMY